MTSPSSSVILAQFQQSWLTHSESTKRRLSDLESWVRDLANSVKSLLDSIEIAKGQRSSLREDLARVQRLLNLFVGTVRSMRQDAKDHDRRIADLERRMKKFEIASSRHKALQQEVSLLAPLVKEILTSWDCAESLRAELTKIGSEQRRQAKLLETLAPDISAQVASKTPMNETEMKTLAARLTEFLKFGEEWKTSFKRR